MRAPPPPAGPFSATPNAPPPGPGRRSRALGLAALALAFGCTDYVLTGDGDEGTPPQDDDVAPPPPDDDGPTCPENEHPAEEVGPGDECVPDNPSTAFTPIVEWEYGGFDGCLALPVVGDLEGDGITEVVVNISGLLLTTGDLVVLRGDGGGLIWSDPEASLGFGAAPALADLDDDGEAEILVVREYETSIFFGAGDYTVVAYSATGEQLWESEHFQADDFEYATAIAVSDMDHDGSPEIVAGRVILNADGTTRGVGIYGSGTSGLEGAISAISDLDLDGIEEVITGNTLYDPDGNVLWYDPSVPDGYPSIGNLDEDPEGEFVVVASDRIRAHDTDGSLLWGPLQFPANTTLSSPAIGDVDVDGWPEIVFAGSNQLYALNHDGTVLWSVPVIDESGATSASIFDFGGDGRPEVVYVDEVEVMAVDGPSGDVVFLTDEHGSNTMFDYPVIADVDGDDEAEVVVCHNGYSSAISVYGDPEGSWVPARAVWNQHAYGISNIEDDLGVPVTAVPSFVDSNTWHSAVSTHGSALAVDLEGEFVEICDDECESGVLRVTVRVLNRGLEAAPAGIGLALYAEHADETRLVATATTSEAIESGWTSAGLPLEVAAEDVVGASRLILRVDDDGNGTGATEECAEGNNDAAVTGPFCGG